ncbi:YciI family protein [Pedobacter foliorum]|uniref:YciI family protein n=1 Tax=Pedobacter foliorum TaxID=2739058 RepID=UPI00156788AA|nr:YciI family protein [Pedobacter foliorum]NRF42020.1 transcription initiation protein [Pedobacter foliorum]
MKEFLFVFRNDYQSVPKGSPEEMQAETKLWMDWIGGIAAQNKLVDRGNRLSSEGNTVKPGNVITDGPFMEIKEAIGGYTLVRAESLADATEMAKGCPIYQFGGSVEVRAINPL